MSNMRAYRSAVKAMNMFIFKDALALSYLYFIFKHLLPLSSGRFLLVEVKLNVLLSL